MRRAAMAAMGIALALAAMFGTSVSAQAGFAPGNEVIGAAEQFSLYDLDVDTAGNAIVAWDERPTLPEDEEVMVRRVAPGGELGPPITVSLPGENARFPAVAAAPGGRAFVAWRAYEGDSDPRSVKGRWVENDGSLGPLLTVAPGVPAETSALDVHVVVDAAGVATVSWENEFGSALGMRRVQPDSSLGAIFADVSKGIVIDDHQVAALPNGDTLAIWHGGGGVEKNVLTASGVVGTPEELAATKPTADTWLAADREGNALAVWRQDGGEFSIRGRRMGPTGEIVGGEMIVDPDQPKLAGIQVTPFADSSGDFLVTWSRQDAQGDFVVFARGVNSAGTFAGPAQPLSSGLGDGRSPVAALQDAGTRAVVWTEAVGGGESAFGRTLDFTALPTTGVEDLSGEGNTVSVASEPAVGVAYFAIYYPTSGSAGAAVMRRFLVPPTCADAAAAVRSGPNGVPVSCSGPAIEGGGVLEAPQHGTVGGFDLTTRSFQYTPEPGYEGPDSFLFALSNDGGSGAARANLAVDDTASPRITELRLIRPRRKRARATDSARRKRRAKPVYRFRLGFSEPAGARLVIQRAKRGVRRGDRCRKAGRRARGRRCTRWVRIGRRDTRETGLRATLVVRGRLVRKIQRGRRFRAVAVATDRAGNRSSARRLKFRAGRRR